MVYLHRAQRRALKRVFDRSPILVTTPPGNCLGPRPISYREFRRTVQPAYGCVMVHWKGMWLGIEPDGYTHS